MWRWIRSLGKTLFRRSRLEGDMAEELRCHIEERADHLVREGMDRKEASRRARVEFGATEAYKEECRAARGARRLDEFARNLRYAGRSLHRRPGFAVIAILSLALGIGGNVAIFSLLHRLVLAKLPVKDADSLIQVVRSGNIVDRISYPRFERLRDNFDLFETLFGWTNRTYELNFVNSTREVTVNLVTGNYFDELGIRPLHGRLLRPEDDRLGAAQGIVLSYGLWRDFFGGDESAVGRHVTLQNLTFEIVGVAPPEFLGLELGFEPDAYLPHHAVWRFDPEHKYGEGANSFATMARLKPGIPLEAAKTRVREQWLSLMSNQQVAQAYNANPVYPELREGSRGYSRLRMEFSQALYALMGLAVAVFLIACANLASLLVVRGIERTGETSMRLALGANRSQIAGQWMTECLLLAGIGGAVGLMLAYWTTELLLLFVRESDRGWLRFQVDSTALLVGVGLTIVAGVLFGLFPAFRASRLGVQDLIKENSTTVIGRRGRVAHVVLTGQVAVALVLAVAAALFTKTLWNLNQAPAGLETEAVAYAQPLFWKTEFPRDKIPSVINEVLERLQNSPNIASVSMVSGLPFVYGSGGWGAITVPGYTFAPDEPNLVYFKTVTPGYFTTLGIPLLKGRDFEQRDRTDRFSVAIVNERFARHYFSDRDPIGQEFLSGRPPKFRSTHIVGVVGDTVDSGFREEPRELVYGTFSPDGYAGIVVRAQPRVDAAVCEAEIRAALASLAPKIPVESGTMRGAVQESLRRDRLVAELSAAFGVLGMLLAAVGLYGATAHMARSRRREIGLRIALGAQRSDIVRLMLRENVWIILAGTAIGLAGAVAVGRVIESLLFGITPTDPLTLGTAAVLLGLVALMSSLWPALRASRLNPLESLRYE